MNRKATSLQYFFSLYFERFKQFSRYSNFLAFSFLRSGAFLLHSDGFAWAQFSDQPSSILKNTILRGRDDAGALTQSSTRTLLFVLMAAGEGIFGGWRGWGHWNCQGNRRPTLSPPSPASVIAERSAAHAAQHKRLSAGERQPISTVSLFSPPSASRAKKNPPRIAHRRGHNRAITAWRRHGGSPSSGLRL